MSVSQGILKDNVNIVANFMPNELSEQQKENLVETCQNIQEQLEREPEFLSKMITGADKTWVYGCSQEMQQHSFQLKSPTSSPCLQRARGVYST
jgi:hypothetical protein